MRFIFPFLTPRTHFSLLSVATRMADHLLQYGDTAVRRAVPLALGLCHVSDPDYGIVDILSKLSHDSNEETVRVCNYIVGVILEIEL